ncbi:MAG TPA: endonuclease/exonuclease/phosphatase family protein [Flavisolibacter sp.]|nr:endonuclease/exonuclease/phosphatase family protein [Flavisolibacter sp.]
MEKNNLASRRTFLKGLSLAAATPLFHSIAAPVAEERKVKNLHRIFCANIRVALPEDDVAGVGWSARKKLCAKVMSGYTPDIICMQEVLKVQMDDMRKAFPKFDGFGFDGPEMDAHTEGYHGIAKNPILFSKERYELRGGGTYWLSDTPLIGGSASWGTARARNCNWLRLKEKKTGREFRIINTHLDHEAQLAREKQIETIIAEAAQYATHFPQVFAGDFNSRSTNPVVAMLKKAGWQDTYAALHGDADPGYTAHAFKGAKYAEDLASRGAQGGRIDFIFGRGVTPKKSAIVKDEEAGFYPSDHYFIYADVEI